MPRGVPYKPPVYSGIILLDGPDGVGKTTLAKTIMKKSGARYIHLTYKYPDKMFEYQTAALHLATKWAREGIVIIDRHWMSECVYAATYRNGSRWPHMGRMMDRVLQAAGAISVVCLPPDLETHREFFSNLKNQRYEMYDDQMEVARRFLELWNGNPGAAGDDYAIHLTRTGGVHHRRDFVRYCLQEMGDRREEFVDNLLYTVTTRRNSQFYYATKKFSQAAGEVGGYNHNFLGFLDTAEWLFVGDQCEVTMRGIRWPFYGNDDTSLLMSDALHEIAFDERRAVWVNVDDYFGGNGIVEAFKKKPNLRVLFLGNSAQEGWDIRVKRHLTSLAIYPEVYKVVHPQYAVRFNQRGQFVGTLANLIGG